MSTSSEMRARPALSVVIVNYNSADYLPRCVASVMQQEGVQTDVTVVDNASPVDPSAVLAALEDGGVRVIRSTLNRGYGGGCNLGWRSSAAPFVALLNADVVARPGAMRRLVDHLQQSEQVGLVEPRTYIDDGAQFRVPEIHPLNESEIRRGAWSQLSGRYARRASLSRLRRHVEGWNAQQPRSQEALTGAFLVTRRQVLESIDGFDEAYPLYFEDADLFRRVREVGLELQQVPTAEAVHYGHRSAATEWDVAMEKCRIGKQRYLRDHVGPAAVVADARWSRWVAALRKWRTPKPRDRFDDHGEIQQPPAWGTGLPDGTPFVLELAIDPWFVLSAGCLGEGAKYTVPPETWDSLAPTTYFARAVSRETWKPAKAWTFRKPMAP